ncbi:MAG TPA: N-acetyl-gamma-glutamyl-phosphate reductase [Polyangiaceae bacterium]|nr:N-acetyl-gamma-glutamyl-phosphate reductase [Polyangiaceae bacterium]
MKRFRAAVYGGSGYLGSEAVRRLLAHPAVELAHVYAADHIGEPLGSALFNLEGKTTLRFEPVPEDVRTPDVDILLLALPHPVSHRIVAGVQSSGVRIIYMSGAFRVDDPAAYQKFYGERHPLPHLLKEFVYGLPELRREALRGARYVASPGCFATTVELGLLPLARAGWLSGPVQCVGMTGSSGAGATPTPTTHHPVRAGNLRAYRPLLHNHAPEIKEALERAGGRDLEIEFVPVAAPLARGILATSFASVPADVDAARLRRAWNECFAGEHFVILPQQRLPEVVAVAGSNYAEVGFALGEPRATQNGGRRPVTCVSALDNLVKGGAGQAIQNLNLMLGLEEGLGLTDPGTFP